MSFPKKEGRLGLRCFIESANVVVIMRIGRIYGMCRTLYGQNGCANT